MRLTSRRIWVPALALVVAAAIGVPVGLAVTGGAPATAQHPSAQRGDAGSGRQSGPDSTIGQLAASNHSLAKAITKAQQRLKQVPGDWVTWGQLGEAYVQEAKITVNPMYYPKALGVIKKSLSIKGKGENYVADTAMASLLAADHKFARSLSWSTRAQKIDGYNAAIFGIKADALTQLGRYDDAKKAIQRELDLQPGTPAFARASYAFELEGNVDRATSLMRQALDAGETPYDKGFAYYYLGNLAFNYGGDASKALTLFEKGLKVDPTYSALREGKAKAEAALGRTKPALADWKKVVAAVPQPMYVREYGEYLQSLGKDKLAAQQYALFRQEERLFEANGVLLELEPALYNADHHHPKLALKYGTSGVKRRPFLEVQDALAWAYHRNGDEAKAMSWEHKAMAEGMRNALFFFHAGMIEKAMGQSADARRDLSTALSINPHFSPLQAPIAKRTLASLGGPTAS